AQRLVRLLCPFCKEPYEAREVDQARIREVLPEVSAPLTLYSNKGCEKCGYTGFRGRQAIFEVLPVSESVRSAIVAGKDAGAISHLASKETFRPLIHHGFRKAVEGLTTLSEVLRVTSLSLSE
ncbi:MAG TPA: type II/IV secretion system protein, partial [Syntrophobacteraceae bacterium]|nr:type II/IV secretion system protein [Syntrophobacteraceae bacterium]